ncbi:MAG: HDOD domain-containing protein [candidate division Zixibacteria bacterium]|nr:HDOD domain-containing protein [candidate division Zixibacteria bacterium]
MVRTVPANATLDKIISTIGDLPASPAVVSAVMGLTSNLDSNVTEVSRLLSSDQSLTAKVLKLSNSSFYGRSMEVKTLQEAILVLGFFTVRSLVVATSAYTMYNKGGRDEAEAKLWRHSLSTAIAARQIAAFIKHPEKEEVFIAALLHDIGKLVLFQKLAGRYDEIVHTVERENRSFAQIESAELGFTHCDIARALLVKWSFPPSLTTAIHQHHEPPTPAEGQPVHIAQVINLGNMMAKKLDVGFRDYRVENLSELESAQVMGLAEEELAELFEEFQQHYRCEVSIFEGS